MIQRKPFTAADDAYIREHAMEGPQAISKVLGREYSSIRDRLRSLGLPVMVRARIIWTDETDLLIRALVRLEMSDPAIAKQIGASVDGVRARRHVLGLPAVTKSRAGRPKATTPRAIKRLRAERRDEERAAYALTVTEVSRDERFVERLLEDGGMPRAVEIRKGVTVWVGAENRPWFDPDRRRVAA